MMMCMVISEIRRIDEKSVIHFLFHMPQLFCASIIQQISFERINGGRTRSAIRVMESFTSNYDYNFFSLV